MDLKQIELETVDRLARIETRQDQIFNILENMPASQAILDIFKKQDIRLTVVEAFAASVNQKIAWIAGVFATLGVALGLLGKYIVDHLTFR